MTKQVNYIDEDYGINFKVFHSEIKLPLVDRYAYWIPADKNQKCEKSYYSFWFIIQQIDLKQTKWEIWRIGL